MQNLIYVDKDKNGKPFSREVPVIRAYAVANGKTVYLHKNGVYGYLNGSPVESFEVLEHVIKNPNQLGLARNWWETRGKKLSEEYYRAKDEDEKKRLMQYEEAIAVSERDSWTYARVSEDGAEEVPPSAWMDFFSMRPEWWGKAREIDLGDYRYIRSDAYETVSKKETVGKTGGKKQQPVDTEKL
jgi:hypothetical protein